MEKQGRAGGSGGGDGDGDGDGEELGSEPLGWPRMVGTNTPGCKKLKTLKVAATTLAFMTPGCCCARWSG